MVGIVTGAGTGLERTSAWVLGSGGQLGRARIGETQDAYVNAANGNLVLTSVDEFLVGLGPDAAIARTYNSQGLIDDGDNGDRWQFGPRRRLTGVPATAGAGTTVTRIDWDGSETVFTWSGGRYVSHEGAGAYDTITRDANGVWSWKDGATGVWDVYDAQGRVVRTEDFDGNKLTYTYNSNGYLERATTADGDSVEFVYGNPNRPARVTGLLTSTRAGGTNGSGPPGLTTRVGYEYDSQGRLQQVVVDLTPADTSDTKRYFTTYSYDGDSQRVASVSQTDGSYAAFTYDASGRVKTVTRAISEGVSQTTTFDYNVGNTKVTDTLGRSTFLHYDTAGQLTKIDGPGAWSGGPRIITEFEYTPAGDLLLLRKSTGTVVKYEYDDNGNRVKEFEQVTPVEGGPATTYNVLTRKFSSTEPSLLLMESVSATADSDGDGPATASAPLITRYVYDAEHHLRFVVTAEGRVTEHTYDLGLQGPGLRTAKRVYTADRFDLSGVGNSQTLSLTDLEAWAASITDKSTVERTDFRYDFRGALLSETGYTETFPNGNGDASPSSNVSRTVYIYDAMGRLVSRQLVADIDPNPDVGPRETYIHDGLGRVISKVSLVGVETLISYRDAQFKTIVTEENGVTTTAIYDQLGNLISVTEANGGVPSATTTYGYDALGRLRTTVDPTGVRTHVLYDHAGRLGAEIDADGHMTEYLYNELGLLAAKVRYWNAVSAGQLALVIDPAGAPLHVLIRDVRPPRNNSQDVWEWRTYDGAQRLTGLIDSLGGVTEYRYDGASRLTNKIAYSNRLSATSLSAYRSDPPSALELPAADSVNDRRERYYFDKDGLEVARVGPEGHVIDTIYDGAGRRAKAVQYFAPLTAGYYPGTLELLRAAIVVTPDKDVHNYWLYDRRGLLSASIDGEGNLTRLKYSPLGYLAEVARGQKLVPADLLSTPPTLASLPNVGSAAELTTYETNPFGDVIKETRRLAGGVLEVTDYAYDHVLRRLLSKTVASGTTDARKQTFRYDGRGRLTGELSGVGSAAYDDLPATATEADKAAVYNRYGTRYVYDVADRLIQKIEAAGSGTAGRITRYVYDVDGRLTHEINALGELTQYGYDNLGRVTSVRTYAGRLSNFTTFSGVSAPGGAVAIALQDAVAAIRNDAADTVVTRAYDTLGRLTESRDGEGALTRYEYTTFGELKLRIDPLEMSGANPVQTLRTAYLYDQRGLTLSETRDAAGAALTESYAYDFAGRRTKVTNARQGVTETLYDRAGRVAETIDALQKRTVFGYDARGNVISRTDRTGAVTTSSPEAAWRLGTR